jgi:hypothetical protein
MNILIAHLVGDFLFQNRWMATQKGSNWAACLIHCFLYALAFIIFAGWLDWRLTVIFLSHLAIDRWRLAAIWRLFFSRDRELPWIIMSDQAIHFIILWIIA